MPSQKANAQPPVQTNPKAATDPMDAIKAAMRAAGMRVTAPVTAIARCVAQSKAAVSHADVMSRLERSHLDRVTVYRVLDRFARLGVVTKHTGSDGVARYSFTRSATGPTNSLFECTSCHSLTQLEADAATAAQLAATLAQLVSQMSPQGAQDVGAALTLRGTCQGCAAG